MRRNDLADIRIPRAEGKAGFLKPAFVSNAVAHYGEAAGKGPGRWGRGCGEWKSCF